MSVCRMKAYWWSCVLGLLCMPAEVILTIWNASQKPSSLSFMRINSSVQITCTTSLPAPMGLYLRRRFHSQHDTAYLNLHRGVITNKVIPEELISQIHITPAKQQRNDHHEFTFQLSLLAPKDTDLYYCEWVYMDDKLTSKKLASNGTIIIIREGDPDEQCKKPILDITVIILCVAAVAFILLFFIGVLIFKCKRYRKKFRPNRRAPPPPRPARPQHICSLQQQRPYLVTSLNVDYSGVV